MSDVGNNLGPGISRRSRRNRPQCSSFVRRALLLFSALLFVSRNCVNKKHRPSTSLDNACTHSSFISMLSSICIICFLFFDVRGTDKLFVQLWRNVTWQSVKLLASHQWLQCTTKLTSTKPWNKGTNPKHFYTIKFLFVECTVKVVAFSNLLWAGSFGKVKLTVKGLYPIRFMM